MDVYHVIYNQTDGTTGDAYVVASSEQNAAAEAQTSDNTYVSLVTATVICPNVMIGS